MKHRLTKTLPLLLLLTLALCSLALAGCGGDDGPQGPTADFVYVPEYIAIDGDDQGLENISRTCYAGGKLYISAYGVVGQAPVVDNPILYGKASGSSLVVEEVEEEAAVDDSMETEPEMYDVYGQMLFSVNLDGSNLTKLENYAPPKPEGDSQGDGNMQNMCVDGQGRLWVLENIYAYHIDADGNWIDDGQSYYVRQLDATGAEVSRLDLGQVQATVRLGEEMSYFYIQSMEVDDQGNVYLSTSDQAIFVLDSSGALICRLEVENWINNFSRTNDGTIVAMVYGNEGMEARPIDLVAKGWGEAIELPLSVYDVYPGGGDYALYYSDSSYLYGYDAAAKESVQLLNWIDCDLNRNNMNAVTPLADGRVLCTMSNYSRNDGRSKSELVILTRKPIAEVPQKIILTMACNYLDYNFQASIIDFNKRNQEYRIRVEDYSQYNTEDDWEAGITKLNTEIVTGKVPDIISVSQLPISQYIAKGLLEPVDAFIEADSELNGQLMEGPLNAVRVDGQLYQVSPNFSIMTCLGATSVVGPEMGWTVEEMQAILDAHPGMEAFAYEMTRGELLENLLYLNMNAYVDWNTGDCNFESENFIKMLEFIAPYPEEIEWDEDKEWVDPMTKLARGEAMLYPTSLYDFQEFAIYEQVFGGSATFIGYPSESGNGSVVGLNSGLVMSSQCQHKEVAWEFMRTLLTEDYQTENVWWDLPTNKAVFQAKLDGAMEQEYDSDGNPVSKYGWGTSDGTEYQAYALTQAQADKIMALIDSTTTTYGYDSSLLEIITEEANAFFNGQKSAADAAAMIQSRVSIYVNEQR